MVAPESVVLVVLVVVVVVVVFVVEVVVVDGENLGYLKIDPDTFDAGAVEAIIAETAASA